MILTITNWNRNSSVAQLWFHVTTTLLSKPSLNHLDVRWQTHAVASWARGLCGGCKISIHDAVVLPTVATASRRALGHYCCVILGWSTTIHVSDFDSELQTEDNRWSFYFYSIYEELHSWWFHSIQISQMTLVQFYLCRNKSQQRVPQSASKTQINRQKQSARVFVSLSKQIISVMDVDVLPCRVCDSASAPQFDWTSGPRTVTNELPRLVSATFSGATWLNWTEERQPMKPLEAPCITSSSKFSSYKDTAEEWEMLLASFGQSWMRRTDCRDLLVTLPNVSDRMRISSASDDSVYFLWMSWLIWLDRKKSDNKVITRNSKQGNSSCSSA